MLAQYRAAPRVLAVRCMTCNKPKHEHQRDKFGNIVLRPEFRSIDNPPICVPGRSLGRKLDAPFTKAGAFGRRVA